MRIDILTVVPELLTSPLNESILHRAQEKGLVQIVVHNLHDYAHDRRKTDRKSTRLNSSHPLSSRMPSSA